MNPLFRAASVTSASPMETDKTDPVHKMETESHQDLLEAGDCNQYEEIARKEIGDPQKYLDTYKRRSFSKTIGIIQNSHWKVESSLLFKSKSEGNLNELIDDEQKPSILKTIYRSLMRKQKYKVTKELHYSSPCLLNVGPRDTESNHVKMQKEEKILNSLPMMSPDSSTYHQPLFSCFNTQKPTMPSHKNVLRPRDVKESFLNLSDLVKLFLQFSATVKIDRFSVTDITCELCAIHHPFSLQLTVVTM